MKKKIFLILIGIAIGGLLFGTISAAIAIAYEASDITYAPSDTSWQVSNVQSAIDDLYSKSEKGYVALFSGSSSIITSSTIVPIVYANSDFVSSNNNQITINKAGDYQVIATVSHSPRDNTYSSYAHVYLNDEEIKDDLYSATNDFGTYLILNKTITLSKGDVIYSTTSSNANKNGIRGASIILIKV